MRRREYPNGAVTTQVFDPAGNVEQIINGGPRGLVSQLWYAYDKANHRTVQQEDDGTVTTWTYDPTYQLVNERSAGGPTAGFNLTHTYDRAGNRTALDDGL